MIMERKHVSRKNTYIVLSIIGWLCILFGSLLLLMLLTTPGTWTAGTYVYFGFFLILVIAGFVLVISYYYLKSEEAKVVHSIECPRCGIERIPYYIRENYEEAVVKVKCPRCKVRQVIYLPLSDKEQWIERIKDLFYRCAHCEKPIKESSEESRSGNWIILYLECPIHGRKASVIPKRKIHKDLMDQENEVQPMVRPHIQITTQSPPEVSQSEIDFSNESQMTDCDICRGTGICGVCKGEGKIEGTRTCGICDGTGLCFCRHRG